MADTLLLVEGVSDEAAILATAQLLGRDLRAEAVTVVALGGATNVAKFVAQHPGERMLGLCDRGEARFFERALL